MNEPGPAPQGIASVICFGTSDRPRTQSARAAHTSKYFANPGTGRNIRNRKRQQSGSETRSVSDYGMKTAGKKCTHKSLRTKSERQDGIRPVAPIDPDRCDRRRTENRVARQLIRPNATKKGQGQTVRRCCIKIGNTGQENKFFGRNFHP